MVKQGVAFKNTNFEGVNQVLATRFSYNDTTAQVFVHATFTHWSGSNGGAALQQCKVPAQAFDAGILDIHLKCVLLAVQSKELGFPSFKLQTNSNSSGPLGNSYGQLTLM